MARFLTAADIVITLTNPAVFSAPFTLQGFATDDVFSTESLDIAETAMGVDGKLSAGYVPKPVMQRIMLQADSPSIDYFEAIYAAQVAQRATYPFTGVMVIPATEKTYNGNRGFLIGYSPTPTAKKTLQPREFGLAWENLSPGPN